MSADEDAIRREHPLVGHRVTIAPMLETMEMHNGVTGELAAVPALFDIDAAPERM